MKPALTETIPSHLEPFIAKQDASLYTPIDHASWRFILRVSQKFFSNAAHQKYLDGLKETGISTERIPLVEEMDQKLRRFGWRAVPVSGFIPPAAFMEFQSLGILPIACEMRTLEHLAYTPAPDIVHEAAGHAPIIADPEYATYLRHYGEVSRKAIFSKQDMDLYEAVRDLSDIKEDPTSTPARIEAAQRRLDETTAAVNYVSEANLLARMNWWTVEYGLVGGLDEPKIYGAGLLSSVGESYHCLSDEVRKIAFTLDCVNTSYDITRPQPQLFVVPDFRVLTEVLEEFARTMAFRRGGMEGLAKAKMGASVTTTELESGIQVSGVLAEFLMDSKGEPCFLKFSGPVQMAYRDQELDNQGPRYHKDGFSSPIGKVSPFGKPASLLSPRDLEQLGFTGEREGKLHFESGIELHGRLKSSVVRDGLNLILTFENCTIRKGGQILYRPEWGVFDLACGEKAITVFGGAADRAKYLAATGGFKQTPRKPKTNLTEENRALNGLYAKVRDLRERGEAAGELSGELEKIHLELERGSPSDWLLRLELLELAKKAGLKPAWESKARERLREIAATAQDKHQMISRGLELL